MRIFDGDVRYFQNFDANPFGCFERKGIKKKDTPFLASGRHRYLLVAIVCLEVHLHLNVF